MAITINCVRGLAKKFNLEVVTPKRSRSIRVEEDLAQKSLIADLKSKLYVQEYFNTFLKTTLHFRKNKPDASFTEYWVELSKTLPAFELVKPELDRKNALAKELFLAMPDEMKLEYLEYVQSFN